MSKHEIRLRRQKLTARGAERFRNYGAVLERHEQEKKIKRILRAFAYFLAILVVVLLIVITVRIERKSRQGGGVKTTTQVTGFRIQVQPQTHNLDTEPTERRTSNAEHKT